MYTVEKFQFPRYNEIPNVGLYLKQVVKFINDSLEPLFHISVTETMLSNYVKMHMVASPVKKQYFREQIAALYFIVLAKTVVSLENIQVLLKMQEKHYDPEVAYDYFCMESENVFQYVYGYKDSMDVIGAGDGAEKRLLRNIIITIAHKFYLEECFLKMKDSESEQMEKSEIKTK